ncbi:MAG: universal stress protein [Fibrella sp.]|nr:universal stress protein [Armatimonadota bacterium]
MIVEIRDEVATLRGGLAKNQGDAIFFALTMGLRHRPSGMVLDLGDVTQATADGAQSLREAAARVTNLFPGVRLIPANASANITRVVSGNGISGPIVATVAEARATLKSLPSPAVLNGADSERGQRRADGSSRYPVVIAGLLGSEADAHAVAVACRLAGSIPSDTETGEPVARMHLAHVLIVPRDRSLLAPLDAEESAVKRLTQFAFAVEDGGCVADVITQIERTRDGGVCLTELAGELRATFLVLALGTNASSEDVSMARYVVERAPCEVIVNRVRLSDLQGGDEAVTSGKEQKHDH